MSSAPAQRALIWFSLIIAPLCSLTGCYFPEVTLTPAQEAQVKESLLTTRPTPQHSLNVEFGGQVRLLGVDLSADSVRPGETVTVTYYLEGMSEEPVNYKVLTHLQGSKRGAWQNLDHVPVKGLFPLKNLKKGQLIKDVQTFRVKPNFPSTTAKLYWGLYRGQDRLTHSTPQGVEHDGKRRVVVARLKVSGRRYLPKAKARRVPPEMAITLDGHVNEPAWQTTEWTRWWGNPMGVTGKRSPMTRAKYLWTPEALYIAVEARDSDVWGTLTERDSNTWEQEVIELFIDADGDRRDYLELQVTPANVVFDARFKSYRSDLKVARAWNMKGFETAVWVDGTLNERGDQDRAWFVEMKVPAREVPGAQAPLSEGMRWRFNMFRFDLPQGKKQWAAALSPPLVPDFHALDAFAELRFLAMKPGVGLPKEPQATPSASTSAPPQVDLGQSTMKSSPTP